MERTDERADRLRALWVPLRLLLLACSGVAWLVALHASNNNMGVAAAAGVVAAGAAVSAAVWDSVLLVHRKHRVDSGEELFSVIDPLDFWYPVASLAFLPLVIAIQPGLGHAARWLIVALCLTGLVLSATAPRVLKVVPKR